MSFYNKHVFFCTNQKDDHKKCCAQGNAVAMWQHAKERCKAEGLSAANNIRISKAGCLGRCSEGPCIVIYPQARWYTYHNAADVDKIIEQELMENHVVSELLIAND